MRDLRTVEPRQRRIVVRRPVVPYGVRGDRNPSLRVNRLDDRPCRLPPVNRAPDAGRDDMETGRCHLLSHEHERQRGRRSEARSDARNDRLVVIRDDDDIQTVPGRFAPERPGGQRSVADECVDVKIRRENPVLAVSRRRPAVIGIGERSDDEPGAEEEDGSRTSASHKLPILSRRGHRAIAAAI
jgi:hypothetical protein